MRIYVRDRDKTHRQRHTESNTDIQRHTERQTDRGTHRDSYLKPLNL